MLVVSFLVVGFVDPGGFGGEQDEYFKQKKEAAQAAQEEEAVEKGTSAAGSKDKGASPAKEK